MLTQNNKGIRIYFNVSCSEVVQPGMNLVYASGKYVLGGLALLHLGACL